jgi:hypothetical protein
MILKVADWRDNLRSSEDATQFESSFDPFELWHCGGVAREVLQAQGAALAAGEGEY